MRLSRLVAAVPGSATLGLAAQAKALADTGVDVISMAVGEPDFQAPEAARQAGHRALDSGKVRYTAASGQVSLRDAIRDELQRTRGLDYARDEIVVCHSCKHALAQALQALVDPGDEVLLMAPAWNSYEAQVSLFGGRPRWVQPRTDLGPDLKTLRAAIGPGTRGVMLNSPSNPSGYVWARAELEALVALAEEHDLWILSDEIYRRLVYDGAEAFSPAAISPAGRARTIVVDGASKAYAMTGYRMGFLAAPAPLAKAVANLQSQTTGCPNYISQQAYEAAVISDPEELSAMRAEFDRRRLRLVGGLGELGFEVATPRGAFYAFPKVSDLFDERGASGLCADLLEQEAIAIVPGDVFGMPEHVRLSYALSYERIEEALVRLGRFVAERRG